MVPGSQDRVEGGQPRPAPPLKLNRIRSTHHTRHAIADFPIPSRPRHHPHPRSSSSDPADDRRHLSRPAGDHRASAALPRAARSRCSTTTGGAPRFGGGVDSRHGRHEHRIAKHPCSRRWHRLKRSHPSSASTVKCKGGAELRKFLDLCCCCPVVERGCRPGMRRGGILAFPGVGVPEIWRRNG
jgi:hypothetical protein